MNIKELRTKEGLSQSALAKKLGVATSAIGHMENGRMKVSAKIAAKVKEEFGVDVADADGHADAAYRYRRNRDECDTDAADELRGLHDVGHDVLAAAFGCEQRCAAALAKQTKGQTDDDQTQAAHQVHHETPHVVCIRKVVKVAND